MLEDLPDVPLAVPLLVAALSGCSSFVDARKRVKQILPDLKAQSAAYQLSSITIQSPAARPTDFEIHLDGALDPFSSRTCAALPCRIELARRLSRSLGLIADCIWLTDLISERFVDFGRATNNKLDRVVGDAFVLRELYPLIQAGIIKFKSPVIPICSGCLSHFDNAVDAITTTLVEEYGSEITVIRPGNGTYQVGTGSLYEPEMWLHGEEKNIDATATQLDFAEDQIYKATRGALWAARDASLRGGAIFSNSRVGLAGLMQKEGRPYSKNHLALLDDNRRLDLPWVSELRPSQILELRQEASKALPNFREMVAKSLSTDEKGEIKSASDFDDLRSQAAQVRAELEGANKKSTRFWKTTYGVLGLGISAYGVATDSVMPALGGLLPVLQLLIAHKTGHEADVDELKRRPGYVLVKAQDILAHAH